MLLAEEKRKEDKERGEKRRDRKVIQEHGGYHKMWYSILLPYNNSLTFNINNALNINNTYNLSFVYYLFTAWERDGD